nr:TRAP transporter small permease [Aquimarina aggregata]
MKLRKNIDRILGNVLVVILAVMFMNVLWQVFSRFVLDNPSSFTDELARYLMIWLGLLGAAYVSGKNMHVAIDVLPSRSKKKVRQQMQFIVQILIILFCFLALCIGGARLVYLTYILEQYSPALRIPLALVYAVLPISGTLIIYYKVSDIIKK